MSNIEQDALTILTNEIQTCENGVTYITEKVSFNIRNLVRLLRKHYWGIFDQPIDPQTGRPKIWVPLTEFLCDNTVKNIDLDTKDINFRAKKPSSIGLTAVIRNAVKNYLDEINFGEHLDQMERDLCIDGTVIWKTFVEKEKGEKAELCLEQVDFLNFYIDYTAKSIKQACERGGVIERSIMNVDDLKQLGKAEKWLNIENLGGVTGLSATDPMVKVAENKNVKEREVYERWGQFSKKLITGKKTDEDKFVFGRIVGSGISGHPDLIHLIEIRPEEDLPYEEVRYSTVSGRWAGRGVAERLLMLQVWLNTIVNIRIVRSYTSQLGIFKVARGSNITAQQLGRLAANGAIMVNKMDDIEQIAMQEASQASYQDEANIKDWARNITSSYESTTGELMPSSMPATNAAIQSRSAQSQFTFIKKGIGMFLQRWVKNHVLPFVADSLRKNKDIILAGDSDEIRDLDERVANSMLAQRLEEMNKKGEFFDTSKVEAERQRILDVMSRKGESRFVTLSKKVNPAEFDVQVYVTNEEIDKAVLSQNLITMLQTLPNIPNSGIEPIDVARQIFDLMGLDVNALRSNKVQAPMPGAPAASQAGQPAPQASMPAQMAEAMTGAAAGTMN